MLPVAPFRGLTPGRGRGRAFPGLFRRLAHLLGDRPLDFPHPKAALVVGGAVLKEPLVRDRNLRFAVYGSCALMALAEIVYLAVCWQPALLYAGTGVTQFGGESTLAERYQALSAAAEPMAAVRWIALAAVVAAWLVWGMQAYRHAKKN